MLQKVKVVATKALYVGLFLLPATIAHAQRGGSSGDALEGVAPDVPGRFDTLANVINTIFNIVIAASGAIFVILLLVGGIQYLTAAGNEESVGNARKLLINSIVGLIIVLSAWALGTWILQRVGLR